jgi:hypothetical protein
MSPSLPPPPSSNIGDPGCSPLESDSPGPSGGGVSSGGVSSGLSLSDSSLPPYSVVSCIGTTQHLR